MCEPPSCILVAPIDDENAEPGISRFRVRRFSVRPGMTHATTPPALHLGRRRDSDFALEADAGQIRHRSVYGPASTRTPSGREANNHRAGGTGPDSFIARRGRDRPRCCSDIMGPPCGMQRLGELAMACCRRPGALSSQSPPRTARQSNRRRLLAPIRQHDVHDG